MKKDELKDFMKSNANFKDDELGGSKEVLLRKLFHEPPSVTFLIDSRECLQRVLVVFLHRIGYDDTHLFNVKTPFISASGNAMIPLDAPFGGRSAGVITLDDCRLSVGHWIKFEYDFGSTSHIQMHVDGIENRDSVLPEELFVGHPTRAQVLEVHKIHHVAPQYN